MINDATYIILFHSRTRKRPQFAKPDLRKNKGFGKLPLISGKSFCERNLRKILRNFFSGKFGFVSFLGCQRFPGKSPKFSRKFRLISGKHPKITKFSRKAKTVFLRNAAVSDKSYQSLGPKPIEPIQPGEWPAGWPGFLSFRTEALDLAR